MKKILLTLAAIGALSMSAQAMTIVNTTPVYNGTVASTQTVIIDMNAGRTDYLSVTASYSTATLSNSNFTDGAKSTATIVVVSTQPLVAVSATDTITISTNSGLAAANGSDSINVAANGSVSGSTLTIAGTKFIAGVTYVVGVSSNATAINLASIIPALVPNVTATVSPVGGSSVTLTCLTAGSFCNSYTVAFAGSGITTTGANFTGGQDNASFTIGTPVGSYTFTQGQQWTVQLQSSNTAVSATNGINATPIIVTASTSSATTILLTVDLSGTTGNAFTLSASTAALSIGNAKFTGGQDPAVLCIQGTCGTAGISFAVGTPTGTVVNIQNWINASPTLSQIIISTQVGTTDIVNATATVIGANPYSITSSTPVIKVSGFSAGGVSAINLATDIISVPSNGFADGTQVLFTSNTAQSTAPTGLISGTTYFVIMLDANNIQLATTLGNSTGTIPVPINITAQAANGGGSFTLTPLPLAGGLTLQWLASDDCSHYNTLTLPNNVTVSTVTFTTASAATSSYWDFGQLNPRCLELLIGGPITGNYNLTVTPYGKSQANGY